MKALRTLKALAGLLAFVAGLSRALPAEASRPELGSTNPLHDQLLEPALDKYDSDESSNSFPLFIYDDEQLLLLTADDARLRLRRERQRGAEFRAAAEQAFPRVVHVDFEPLATLRYGYDVPGKETLLDSRYIRVTLGANPLPAQGFRLFAGVVRSTYSARARWYDSRTGLFLSVDPKDDIDSPNLYAFVGWMPHEKNDPLGLETGTITHNCVGTGGCNTPLTQTEQFVAGNVAGLGDTAWDTFLSFGDPDAFEPVNVISGIYDFASTLPKRINSVGTEAGTRIGNNDAFGGGRVLMHKLIAPVGLAATGLVEGVSAFGRLNGTPKVPLAAAEATAPLVRYLEGPNTLRRVATETHRLVENERRFRNSSVAVARVRLQNGKSVTYAASSEPYMSVAQQKYLKNAGVDNILSGEKYRKGLKLGKAARERHAERVINHNLPEGATVEDWGISHAGDQKPIPCITCEPVVVRDGAGVQLGK